MVIGGGTVDNKTVQDAYYKARDQLVLDPLEVARTQQDPRYLQAALAVEEMVQARKARALDAGAVGIDALLAKAGVKTNLAGFRKQPRLFYPIAPGVQYERQLLSSKTGGLGGEVEFIRFDDTPMMDWDIPSDHHAQQNVTVRHLGDVEEIVRQQVRDNPGSQIRLQMTPGGFRAWEVGQRMLPAEYEAMATAMKVDPDYVRISQQPNTWEVEGITVGRPGFSSRISAKPGREGDWVALPLQTFSGSEALPDPLSLQRVRQYHDIPIAQAYLADGVPAQAVEMLKRQAETASAELRQGLGRLRLL